MSRFHIRQRLKAGLKKAMGGSNTPAFDASEWQGHESDYEAVWGRMSTAVTRGWSTTAEELEQALAATQDADTAKELSFTLQDALAPTVAVLRDAQSTAAATWTRAVEAGSADPVTSHASAVPARIATGWDQTLTALAPVLNAILLEADDRDKLARYRDKLSEAVEEGARAFSARTDRPSAAMAELGAAAENLEVYMDGAKQIVVEAAWLSGREPG